MFQNKDFPRGRFEKTETLKYLELGTYVAAFVCRLIALKSEDFNDSMHLCRIFFSYNYMICAMEMLHICYGFPKLAKVIAMLESMVIYLRYFSLIILMFKLNRRF